MSEFNQSQTYVNQAGVTLQAYITRVFTLMGGALAVTALVSFAGFNLVSAALASESMATVAVVIFFAAMIAQFALCFALSRRIATLQTRTATILLYGYAVVTGITFSVLPMVYDGSTLFSAFAFSAVLFFSCAVIGHTTNVDLTKFSGLLIGGLIAMVIATIASMFIPALRESLFISYIGVILFLFLTAWICRRSNPIITVHRAASDRWAETLRYTAHSSYILTSSICSCRYCVFSEAVPAVNIKVQNKTDCRANHQLSWWFMISEALVRNGFPA